ncbi:hypothetical protein JST97_29975 [bacterium]|nr:hypothetical protein [bacterium]
MSLIIWAASSQGLLVASDQPAKIFRISNRASSLMAISGDRPEWDYARQVADYLQQHEVDLASKLHVEALRTVLAQKLESMGEADVTLAFGQHNHDLSGIVFVRVICRQGRAQVQGLETREYGLDSETEFVPMGEDASFFLSRVAQNPKYLKSLRQNRTRLVKDLALPSAVKIAREMISDTRRAGARGLGTQTEVYCVRANQPVTS